jgi:hypothetical protein
VRRRLRYALPLVAALALCGAGRVAIGEAPAGPEGPRLWRAPTGSLQPHGVGAGRAGASHQGHPFLDLAVGVGGVAEVGVTLEEVLACDACDGRDDTRLAAATALFKVGVAEGLAGRWQPAVALGFVRSVLVEGEARPAMARMYLAASMPAGPVRLHAGAEVWDAAAAGRAALHATAPVAARLRPLCGVEYRPGAYPRTTLVADLAWAPRVEPDEITLRWHAGFGVRYQALSWGGVELGVAAREGAGLGDAVVLLRFSATVSIADLAGRRVAP